MSNTSNKDEGLRILLVEDNPFDYQLIEATLQRQFDCQVRTVGTEREFETEIIRKIPDFILSDSNQPGFDGTAALAFAAQRCPNVPFIVCSGSISEKAKTEALAHGAIGCVSKNDLESLVELIKRLSHEAKQDGGNTRAQT